MGMDRENDGFQKESPFPGPDFFRFRLSFLENKGIRENFPGFFGKIWPAATMGAIMAFLTPKSCCWKT